MTDTKHADLPKMPAPLYLGGDEAYVDVVYGYCADQMHAYARAAIAAAAPVGEPVMWLTRATKDGKQKLEFGTVSLNLEYCKMHKDWVWEPLYAAPVHAAAPKAALTDEQIYELFEQHKDGPRCHTIFPEEVLPLARRIEAASGPNAALVEALQDLHQVVEFQIHPPKSNPIRHALDKARAALAAAGVAP